jgi:peptidoglycan/LPS O-acetylase OafA/YrhL
MVVVAWHLLMAFAPHDLGAFADGAVADPLIGRWWFAPFNGNAAVTFFFVLSGYVLALPGLARGDAPTMARGLLRRWPRLAGPCVAVTVGSFLLFWLGAYAYEPAAVVTGSPWLADFGGAGIKGFAPSLGGAIGEGAAGTFLRGTAYHYDSSLWTMRAELRGSVAVLVLAPLFARLGRIARPRVLWVLVVFAALMPAARFWLPAFLAGLVLACWLRERPGCRRPALPPVAAAAMLAAAFVLFGYRAPVGCYAGVPAGLRDVPPNLLAWLPASVLAIAAVLCCRRVADALSGRAAVLLGRLSFPLYLVHVPVLCSLGCLTFLASGDRVLAAAVTFAASVALAWPLARFDAWWVRRVSAVAAFVVARAGGVFSRWALSRWALCGWALCGWALSGWGSRAKRRGPDAPPVRSR